MNLHHPVPTLSNLASDAVDDSVPSLARHMSQCQREQGRWFGLRAQAELVHGVVASRLVTCGALAALCCWALMSVA